MGLGKDNSYKSKPKEIWDMIGEQLEQIEKAENQEEVFRKIFEEALEQENLYEPISIKMYEYQKSKETDETKKQEILTELQTVLEKDNNDKSKAQEIWDEVGKRSDEIEKAEKPEEVFNKIFEEALENSIYKPIAIKMYEYQKSKESDETKKQNILTELQTTLEKNNHKSKHKEI